LLATNCSATKQQIAAPRSIYLAENENESRKTFLTSNNAASARHDIMLTGDILGMSLTTDNVRIVTQNPTVAQIGVHDFLSELRETLDARRPFRYV
jgi:hypothetical protein